MLVSMRKAIQKGLLQVVAWVTVIAMALAVSGDNLITMVQRLFGIKDYAVYVNGESITEKELLQKEASLKMQIQSVKDQYGPFAAAFLKANGIDEKNLDKYLLQQVGFDLLTKSIAKKFSVTLSPEFISKALVKYLPKDLFTSTGEIDYEALDIYLRNNMGVDLATFEKTMESNLEKGVVSNLIASSYYMPKFMLKAKFEEAFAAKRFGVLTLSLDKYLQKAKSGSISNEEIQSYYNNNSNKYFVPATRNVVIWEFPLKNYGIKVTDKEISQYFDKNKEKYQQEPAKIQIRRILLSSKNHSPSEIRQKAMQIQGEILRNSLTFKDAAQKYSDDKDSASKGGLMDFVSVDKLSPEVAAAVKGLEKDGDISDIIDTEEGLQIVQRESRKAAVYKKLEAVKEEIEKTIEGSKFANMFNFESKKAIKDAKSNFELFEKFADSKKANKTKKSLSKDDSQVSRQAFRLKEGQLGAFTEGKTGYVVKVDSILNGYTPELSKIESDVKNDIYKNRALKSMEADLEKIESKAKTENLNDLAQAYDAKFTVTPALSFDSKKEIEKLQKEGLPVDKFLNLSQKGATKKLIENDGYVIKVADVKNREENVQDLSSIKQELYKLYRSVTEQGFIASLAKTGKIKLNKTTNRKRIQ